MEIQNKMTGRLDHPPVQPSPLPRTPLVSVLTANYNYARFLGCAVRSALTQTYSNVEVIVCDDGSTDGSLQVLNELAAEDSRVRFIAQTNGGVSSATNTAFAHSRGDLVALLDADDVWLSNRLQRVVDLFRSATNVGAVVHRLARVTADLKTLPVANQENYDGGWLGPRLLHGAMLRLPPCSGLTFHRQVADAIFPLPHEFRAGADAVARERAALLAPIGNLHETLGLYRIHTENVTATHQPMTVPDVDRALAWFELKWRDRLTFLQSRLGLQADPLPWHIEAALTRLTRCVITGCPHDPADLQFWPHPAPRLYWSTLFRLPRPLAMKGMRLYFTDTPWRRALYRLLNVLTPVPLGYADTRQI